MGQKGVGGSQRNQEGVNVGFGWLQPFGDLNGRMFKGNRVWSGQVAHPVRFGRAVCGARKLSNP